MQSCLDRFASFSVFNENSGFEWNTTKLVVPNKWDNFRLDLCIEIGELVEPLHKIIFSKLFLVASFHSTTSTFSFKIHFSNFRIFKKKIPKLV